MDPAAAVATKHAEHAEHAEPSFEQRLARLLRLIRVGRGLTLQSAAARCGGLSAQRLARWEHAERPMPVAALHALAAAYAVDPGRLLAEASTPPVRR